MCFLFAYANPAHEQAAAKIIRDIAPDLYVSLSHQVNPEWREYERTASTVANAYIGPPVSRYLHELEALSLRRFPRSRALMMKSDGGAASARMLAATPIETVHVRPGRRRHRRPPPRRHQRHRQHHHLRHRRHHRPTWRCCRAGRCSSRKCRWRGIRCARIRSISRPSAPAAAASPSVELGVLKVGPQSAGANPGPACYGRGGSEPTLTDALVVLGHLSPTALLEGAMPISSAKAHEAVRIARRGSRSA